MGQKSLQGMHPHTYSVNISKCNNLDGINLTCCWIIHIYLRMALRPFIGPWSLFSFLIIYIVGRTPWKVDQPVAWQLPTNRTTQTQNKRTQASTLQVGFELTIPVFERAKTIHALDRATTVIRPIIHIVIQKWLVTLHHFRLLMCGKAKRDLRNKIDVTFVFNCDRNV
jgi:hypothetical protein